MQRLVLGLLLVLALVGVASLWFLRPAEPTATDGAGASAPDVAVARAPEASPAEPSAPRSPEPTPAPLLERTAVEVTTPVPARPARELARAEGILLTGRVLDEAGAPLEGARVSAGDANLLGFLRSEAREGERTGEGATDADGRFGLRVRRAGDLRLEIRAARHAPFDVSRAVPAGESFDLGEFTLIPGPIVSGRVVDSRGAGVGGAKLRHVRNVEASGLVIFGDFAGNETTLGETRSDGSFELDILPAGELELRVDSEAHPVLRHKLEGALRAGERREGVVLRLEDGGEISGLALGVPEGTLEVLRVLATRKRSGDGANAMFQVDGEPFEGGGALEQRSTRLAKDGSFELRGLRPDTSYDISLRLYEGDSPLAFAPRMSPRVPARTGDRRVELAYQPESALLFTVVDARTKAPVERYRVEGGLGAEAMRLPYMESGEREFDHPGGVGKLGNLRRRGDSDKVSLWITAPGYREWSRKDLALGPTTETDIGTIELEPAPLLTVTVLDASSGAPVVGARVSLRRAGEQRGGEGVFIARTVSFGASSDSPEPLEFGDESSATARTDESGVARLNSFEGARCTLAVEHAEHAPHRSEPFTCAVGQPEAREVRLSVGGSVRVTLKDVQGRPVAGAKIERRMARVPGAPPAPFSGPDRPEVTDASGVVVFRHLAPGLHRFRADSSSMSFGGGDVQFVIAGMEGGEQEPGWVEAAVAENAETALDLLAPLRVALRGVVTEGGVPLAGALVTLERRADDSEESGRMMMFGMGGGPSARSDGRGRYEVQNVKSGDYTARVTHKSRAMPAEVDVTIGSDDRELDIALDVAVIEGRVTGPDGKPVARAKVTVERPSSGRRTGAVRMVMAFAGGEGEESTMLLGGDEPTARTDEDGRYALRGVQPGVKLVVKAEAKGFRSAKSEELELGPNEVRSRVDLQLLQSGSIEVSVFRGGEPQAEGIVTARLVGGKPGSDPSPAVLQEGRARLEDLEPGRWSVTVRTFGRMISEREDGESTQEVVVEAGKTASLRFDL